MGQYGWRDNKLTANKLTFPDGNRTGTAAGPVIFGGTSTNKITSATADTKFLQFYLTTSATSGDNRGLYLRTYYTGTGGGGDCARIYADVSAACGSVYGAHISCGFGESTTGGSVTGLAAGVRAQLGLPSVALAAGGTYTALMAEIYSFGASADAGAVTELSFIRVVNGGNATGMANVDDDAFLFSLQGFTAGSGHLLQTGTTLGTTGVGTLKVKIGATTGYINVVTAQAS